METIKVERYAKYRDSGVKWLGEIPNDWEVKRLKYIINERNERSELGNEPLLMMSQVHGLVVRADYHKKAEVAKTSEGYKIVYKNDLVFNKLKAHLGVFYKSNMDFNGIVSPDYAVYYSKGAIPNLKYLELLFRTPEYLREFICRTTGIVEGLMRLYTQDLFDIPVPVPPLKEQIAITDFLDRKTALIDQAIDIKAKQIELLQERRQIVIHKVVTRGLNPKVELKDSGVEWIGEVPRHWEVKRLKYVTSLVSEKVSSKLSDYNYIGMENIESWTGIYISTDSETEGLANLFVEGDVLFGKLRPYLAKVYLADKDGICSTEFLIYRSGEDLFNWYLKSLMLSFEFINLVNSSTYGSKMPRANSDFIGNQLIPIPSKQEQFQISEFIKSLTTKVDSAISLKQQEIKKLKEYKSTLINSAVTGKIKVG